MKNILHKIKTHKKYLFIGVPVLLILLYFIFGRGQNGVEHYVVERSNVVQSVSLSGTIMTSDRADLGFASAGRVARILVGNNQNVTEGQILAQLEIGELLADLKIKEINSRTSNVDLGDAKEEVEKITEQEDTKVESAYRALLSTDLEPIPNSDSYDVDPPTISGLYSGVEGQYKITIDKQNIASTNFRIRTFNLEKTERNLNDVGSTALGTKGLFISFPDGGVSSYNNTTWVINVPNKAGDSYVANLNAYNEAKDTRALAIKEAEEDYQRLLTEDGGGDSVAQAEIQKIQAEIRKNTIYAPFDGKVTNIEKEVGENTSVGDRVISILGEEALEVVLQVSELDVSRLVPNSPIQITLDAIPDETFTGILKTVNSRETEIEGVPVYEAFVELEADLRIKTGMSAKGTVVIAERDDVVAIPLYNIKKVGDKSFVSVIEESGATVEKEITLGLLGTDSMVEVTSGLNAGDTILTSSEAKN